jgi:hypothetical protein
MVLLFATSLFIKIHFNKSHKIELNTKIQDLAKIGWNQILNSNLELKF